VPTRPAGPPEPLVARPAVGRVVEGTRKVRLGDVGPRGRLRLDAVARYAQDLAADDSLDAALPDPEAWVVRRTVIEVRAAPRYLERLALATWCSGTGSHYAERRVELVGESGGRVDVAAIWVHLDRSSGRPLRLSTGFEDLYGPAAGGRRVKARLQHGDPPDDDSNQTWPWHLRATDIDVLAHVNNAACWEVVEEALAAAPQRRGPLRAELEHRTSIEPGAAVEVVVADRDGAGGDVALWILADGAVAATATVTPLPD
jgi:acyl-ACP thioesterase